MGDTDINALRSSCLPEARVAFSCCHTARRSLHGCFGGLVTA